MDQQRRAEAKGGEEESRAVRWHFEAMPAVPAAVQGGSWELLAARRRDQVLQLMAKVDRLPTQHSARSRDGSPSRVEPCTMQEPLSCIPTSTGPMTESAKRLLTDDIHNARVRADQWSSASRSVQSTFKCKTLLNARNTALQMNSLNGFATRDRGSGRVCVMHHWYCCSKLTRQTRVLGVMEGYRTTPSSFSKAQSTGSIFRSMNDTLRDVYANLPGETRDVVTRKRARSASVGETEAIPEELEISVDPPPSLSATSSLPEENISNRKIKSLRASSRSYLQTRSLPAGTFAFAGEPAAEPSLPSTAEDDWSQESCFQPSQLSFEPMVFN